MGRGRPFRQNFLALVRAGVVKPPRWLDAVRQVPPQVDLVERTRPPPIFFLEDRLRSRFLARNPEAQKIPIDLNAASRSEGHVADRFASLQAQYMEHGKSEEEAYDLAASSIISGIQKSVGDLADDDQLTSDRAVSTDAGRAFVASMKYVERDQRLFDQMKRKENTLSLTKEE